MGIAWMWVVAPMRFQIKQNHFWIVQTGIAQPATFRGKDGLAVMNVFRNFRLVLPLIAVFMAWGSLNVARASLWQDAYFDGNKVGYIHFSSDSGHTVGPPGGWSPQVEFNFFVDGILFTADNADGQMDWIIDTEWRMTSFDAFMEIRPFGSIPGNFAELRIQPVRPDEWRADVATNELNALPPHVVTFVARHVPEPTSLAILGLGLAGLGMMRRRRAV